MIERGDRPIVVRILNGVGALQCSLCNGTQLKESSPDAGLADEENAHILALYEEVFDHQSFTGRSGTFYK